MGRIHNAIIGFMSAPFIGPRHDNDGWTGSDYSSADDSTERTPRYAHLGSPARPDNMTPFERIQDPGDTLQNRASGVHTLIPSRALSAQTRMKNMSWELPSDTWTRNPETPPYIVRVPGLPQQQLNLATLNSFTTQPEFLQPIVNLQIENDMSWIQQFTAKILGNSPRSSIEQNQMTMFPSAFDLSKYPDLLNG